MIGIVPSSYNTYEVYGDFDSNDLVEGKLYYNQSDKRLYYYSKTLTRSNPQTGYFPIWNGSKIYESKNSNCKYFDKDAVTPDVNNLGKMINGDAAKTILYRQRLSDNIKQLKPQIVDEDNMFTQIVKGIICEMDITKVDLLELSGGVISDRIIESYYSSLMKVTMMRMDKFHLWMGSILKCHYTISVYRNKKNLLKYEWPKDNFDTGIVKFDTITSTADDPLKKIIKIIMIMNNIEKTTLKSDDVDDYTINNMMTIIHSNKSLSAQIFCRFMRMAKLSFVINVYDINNKHIFTYSE